MPQSFSVLSGSTRSTANNYKPLSFLHGVFLLILLVFAVSSGKSALVKDGLLRVYFFDIGQGDSIFIQAPNGNQVLIDGGPDGKVLQKLGEVMPFYDRDIDLVVVSHPHSDHVSGLIEVLERYEVGAILEGGEVYDSADFRAWRKAVDAEEASKVDASAGQAFNLGSGVTLTVLHPLRSVAGTATKTPHNDVVAALLRYKDFELLLTGDMEAKVERRLLLNGLDVDADVLKVGHHGSKTSSGEEFLSAVSPQTAVIQAGVKNRYKHPSPQVLERLETYGIPYYRTDTSGDVQIATDGKDFSVTTER